jgi:hypothetical protein
MTLFHCESDLLYLEVSAKEYVGKEPVGASRMLEVASPGREATQQSLQLSCPSLC